jgi:hypothetical protein
MNITRYPLKFGLKWGILEFENSIADLQGRVKFPIGGMAASQARDPSR